MELIYLESTPKSNFTPKSPKGDFCKLLIIKHSPFRGSGGKRGFTVTITFRSRLNLKKKGLRNFLPTIITLLFFFGISSLNLKAQNIIERKGGAYVKISINAYSFNKLLLEHKTDLDVGISLFDLLDFCAENNIDAIDPTAYYFPGYPDVPSDEFIYKFKKRAHQLGIEISGTGVRNNFANPDSAARANDVKLVKEWIGVAAKLGAPVIRVFAGAVPKGYENKWDEVAVWMAESLKECADYAAKYGVIIGIQNHGGMLRTADQCIKLVNMVDSEWFGLVVDIGYFKTEDPYVDIEKVIPYAVNWQVKERVYGTEGNVKVDLGRLMGIIHRSGYRGYIPVETLPAKDRPYDPFLSVPVFLDEVRAALNAEFNK